MLRKILLWDWNGTLSQMTSNYAVGLPGKELSVITHRVVLSVTYVVNIGSIEISITIHT